MIQRKSVTILTEQYASVLTTTTSEEGFVTNHCCTYFNNDIDRSLLLGTEPQDVIQEVMAVWGDTPALEVPDYSGLEIPKTKDVWDEIAEAIMEGVNEI